VSAIRAASGYLRPEPSQSGGLEDQVPAECGTYRRALDALRDYRPV